MQRLNTYFLIILSATFSNVSYAMAESSETQAPRKTYSPEEKKQYEQTLQKYLGNSQPGGDQRFGAARLKPNEQSQRPLKTTPVPVIN